MENKYIDINKGFHRIGTFSPFDDEIYASLDDAQSYASGGNLTTSAYPGQILKVMNDEEPKIFLIDKNYHLVPVADSISKESKLSINFDYNSGSGVDSVSVLLPMGFIINKITIKVIEPFPKGSLLRIGKYVHYDEENIGIEYLIDDDLTEIDGVAGDEFVFSITETLSEKTRLYIFLSKPTIPEGEPIRGKGILKIN